MKKLLTAIFCFLGILFNFGFAQEYIYFYGQGCPHCAKVDDYFTKNKIYDNYKIDKKEVYFDAKARKDFIDIKNLLKVPEAEWWVPFFVIKSWDNMRYIIWDIPIIDYFKEILASNPTEDKLPVETTTTPDKKVEVWWLKFLAILIPAALADSINPCVFAVMLLLLSTIMSRHRSTKKLFLAWFLFVLAVFLSYLAMGIWLYKALASTNSIYYLKLSVWILWILVWLANLKDYFWYGKVFVMEVPFSWRPAMQEIIGRAASPAWAFVVWLIVSLFLLPCTSWPYITVLGYLSAESSILNTWGYIYLIIYNLIFIIPMIIIVFLVWFGYKTVYQLNELKSKNIKNIHLIVWLLMLGIWGFVLAELFWF